MKNEFNKKQNKHKKFLHDHHHHHHQNILYKGIASQS